MQYKALAIAALTAAVQAQNGDLATTLGSLPELSNLTSYLQLFPALSQQLTGAQNVTLLAPSNSAFAAALNGSIGEAIQNNQTDLIQGLLLYHVLNGTYHSSAISNTTAFVHTALTAATNLTTLVPAQVVEVVKTDNNVTFTSGNLAKVNVTSADHNFTGGTIHIIDGFLTVPELIPEAAIALNLTAAAGALNESGISAGPHSPNVTAFIPNNAAFQAISNILANLSMADLAGVLTYHLVPNIVAYSTHLSNTTLMTAANSTLEITLVGENVYVNNAKVVTPNVLVAEGVIHVIDEVLNPANTTFNPDAASMTEAAFPDATSGSDVPFTSGVEAPTSVPADATGSSSSSGNFAMPMQTGAVGAAALFGAGAVMLNL